MEQMLKILNTNKPEPTPTQLEALKAYAAEKGRYWKDALLSDWFSGTSEGELQTLRNTLGPSWLINFRLTA